MKLERGEKGDDRLGNPGSHYGKAQVLIQFRLGMMVNPARQADELPGLDRLRDHRAADSRFT